MEKEKNKEWKRLGKYLLLLAICTGLLWLVVFPTIKNIENKYYGWSIVSERQTNNNHQSIVLVFPEPLGIKLFE